MFKGVNTNLAQVENNNPSINNNSTEIQNNNNSNSYNNQTNSNNTTINNINLNINITRSFDDDWDTSNIDNKLKLILLLNNSKFTKTLENILENEVNLNILIDKTSDIGLVYENNEFKKMKIKDIVKKSMDKLYKHLCEFHDDIADPNIFDINENILKNELNITHKKYDEFNKNDTIKHNVNKYLTDIYDKNKEKTINASEKNGY